MTYLPAELIKKKREGEAFSAEEIRFVIDGFVRGEIADYQIAAWLMAVYFKGMNEAETATLTEAMMLSGRVLDFSHCPRLAVDKHSTGGVGDKTSMILAPIVAAAGFHVPMIAGRGLSHTGGTLDKLESIPGFRVDLDLDTFSRQVETLGVSIIGQTTEICPADKKIYALRDVTATIESSPLICASIMSKKLAEGIGALVLDIKFGNGAFMKTLEDARALAEKLSAIGVANGKRVAYLLTDMNQPLGRFVGNSLEMGECFAILKSEKYLGRDDFDDCRELSLELAATMIWLADPASKIEDEASGLRIAREKADAVLASGRAWEVFEKMCRAQGGDPARLPVARPRLEARAASDGFVAGYATEKIGIAALSLGAGRRQASDELDPTAGIEVHRKLGDQVRKGDVLFTLYGERASEKAFAEAEFMLLSATTISLQKPVAPALIATRKAFL